MSGVYHEDISVHSVAGLAAGSTGDKATLACPNERVEIVRAWVEWEGASVHATAAIVAFDKRPTAGSDTGRGAGDVAIIKKVTLLNQQGKRTYAKEGTGMPNNVRVMLEAGQEVIVEVTTAQGDPLPFKAGITVRRIQEAPTNIAGMVLTAV